MTKEGAVAACLKHFAGYGAPMGGRDYNTVELSERTLLDDYLPAYQDAIDAGCALVMTSFNTLDRIPSSANTHLMKDILRKEMDFDEVLISDWAALAELVVHGIEKDDEDAARLSMNATVDIDMATPVYVNNLKHLIEQGKITEEMIDDCTFRVLELKNKLGLFENPYKDACAEAEKELLLCSSHRELARKCSEETFVLLENENNFLPLHATGESIAFIGSYVDTQYVNGSWSFFVKDENCVTLKEGIFSNYPEVNASFAPGCSLVDPGTNVISFQLPMAKEVIDSPEKLEEAIQKAVELARASEKVVLALGEHREYTGEAASCGNIELPRCQLELLDRIYQVNQNICVVLFNGRPLDLRYVKERSKAILGYID